MESGDDGLESEANVRPRPRLTGAGQPRGCPAARWTAIDRGLSRDPLAQARLNRSAKGAGTGHSPRYPKSGTTQSDRLLAGAAFLRELRDRYGTPGFLAAYNAGPRRYEEHLRTGRPLPLETQHYVAMLAPIVGSGQMDGRPAVVADVGAWLHSLLFPARSGDKWADDKSLFAAP